MKRYPADILATCVVPWNPDYSFDEETFRQQVRLLRDNLTRRLYVFGTAGEGYAVSDRQFEQIVKAFYAEMMGTHDSPMVGVISLALATVVERIEWSSALGIRDFQISLPCWGALSDHEVDIFFRETCGRFPSCRFLHYNLRRSNRVLTGNDYARLCQAHPNLVAVKFGGDHDTRINMLQNAPELQYFFTEPGYASMRDEFECGLLASYACIDFSLARAFFNARGTHLRKLANKMDRIGQKLRDMVGQAGHMDGAYDKLIIKTHLPDFPLRLLPPYTSLEDLSDELLPSWATLSDDTPAAATTPASVSCTGEIEPRTH
jgi:dihydrodipicolinate synthase/N-acetylneuraminate lyase